MRISFFIKLCLALFGFLAVQKFCLKQTDSFTIASVLSSRPYDARWEARALTMEEQEETKRAIGQKYTYFGRGGQAYIFFSEDRNYVIKLFKQEKFQVPLWLKIVHVPYLLDRYKAKKAFRRDDKLFRDFTSYKTAFEELHKETGLLYIHLNKTQLWNQQLKLVDRLGIEHLVDLDSLDFVVQRRAELVYDRIARLMRENKPEEAKKAISQVVALIVERCQKGFRDRDPNIRTNCGFIGEQAVKIDVGRFERNETMKKKENIRSDLIRITLPFKIWLQEEYPELAAYLEAQLNRQENQG
jgi:hypothetical protein